MLISCEMMSKSFDLFDIIFVICKIMGLALIVTILFSFKIIRFGIVYCKGMLVYRVSGYS